MVLTASARYRRARRSDGSPGSGTARDEGAIAVVVAVTCALLLTLTAIVVDLGLAQDNRRRAQNAADSAALAAAGFLGRQPTAASITSEDAAAAAAIATQFVAANGWEPGAAAVLFDAIERTVTVTLNGQQQAPLFAGITGSDTPTVSARAQATWSAAATCSFCVFDQLALGNGNVLNTGGSILADVIDLGPNGVVRSTAPGGVVGFVTSANGGLLLPQPPVTVTSVPDPFETLADPPGVLGLPVQADPGGTCTPGAYADVSNCTTFAPGSYVVTGSSIWAGNDVVNGTDVTFYLTCSSGGVTAACPAAGADGGFLEFRGNITAELSAPAGSLGGLIVRADRNNTSTSRLRGGDDVLLTGGVYLKRGNLDLRGNGELTINGVVAVANATANGNPGNVTTTAPDPEPTGATGPARLTQ